VLIWNNINPRAHPHRLRSQRATGLGRLHYKEFQPVSWRISVTQLHKFSF